VGRGRDAGCLRRLRQTRRAAQTVVVLLAVTAGPVGASEPDRTALDRFRPVLRYAAEERGLATSIEAMAGRAGTRLVDTNGGVIAGEGAPRLTAGTLGSSYATPGGRRASHGDRLVTPGRPLTRGRRSKPRDIVYGHAARGSDGTRWLQYWLFYEDNPQDRGLLRTGRHAGDWEFVQVRLNAEGRPDRLTMAQHAWSESCDWGDIERSADAPVLYVANGSHATYHRSGTKDRPWPDPNDEADGQGRRVRPELETITASSPGWVAWPGRWGETLRSPVPAESSSPRGPAFKDDRRFDYPTAFDASARPCGSGPPGRFWQTPALLAPVLVLAVIAGRRRWRGKRRHADRAP